MNVQIWTFKNAARTGSCRAEPKNNFWFNCMAFLPKTAVRAGSRRERPVHGGEPVHAALVYMDIIFVSKIE